MVVITLNDLAAFFESQGEYARALQLFEEYVGIRARIFGVDHPETKDAFVMRSDCAKKLAHLSCVESAVQLIDSSHLPFGLLSSATQRVRDRLGVILPSKF
jgi:hypothetical protein